MFRRLLSLFAPNPIAALKKSSDAAALAADTAATEHQERAADLAARLADRTAARAAFEVEGDDDTTDRVLEAEAAHDRAVLRHDRAERRRDETAEASAAAAAALARAHLAADVTAAAEIEQEARAADLDALAAFETTADALARVGEQEQKTRAARELAAAALATFDGLAPAQRPDFAESLTFEALREETAEDIVAIVVAERVIAARTARVIAAVAFQREHAGAIAAAAGGGGPVQPVPASFGEVLIAVARFEDTPEEERTDAVRVVHAIQMIRLLGYNTVASHGRLTSEDHLAAYLRAPLPRAEQALSALDVERNGSNHWGQR